MEITKDSKTMSQPVSTVPQFQLFESKTEKFIPTSKPTVENDLKHMPPKLPVELWDKVLCLLGARDIKSVRAAWRQWTDVGTRYLFKPAFIFRRDRRDFERFDEVMNSVNKDIPSSITSLRFKTGLMGAYWMTDRLGDEYLRNYNCGRPTPPTPCSEYPWDMLDSEFKIAADQYATWNSRVQQCSQRFTDVVQLKAVLQKLAKLDSIEITRRSIGFQHKALLYAWIIGSEATYFERYNLELVAILHALQEVPYQVKHFKHDQLPVTFFASNHHKLLTRQFEHLQTLHLTFDAKKIPTKTFWKTLGQTICSIKQLEDLRLGFLPIDSYCKNRGTWNDCAILERWYTPLNQILGEHVWTKLKSLRFDCSVLCEYEFSKFLLRHSATLKHLEIARLGLWQGSVQGLLSCLKENLELKSFHIWGTLKGFHTDHERWQLAPMYLSDPKPWNVGSIEENHDPLFFPTPPSYSKSLSEKLQDFVIADGTWPFTPEDTMGGIYFPSFHSSACTQCIRPWQDIEEEWNKIPEGAEEWDVPLAFGRDLDPNNFEELVEDYGEFGYDAYDLDAAGYDEDGVFYEDVRFNWVGPNGPITAQMAHRRLLRMMKNNLASKKGRYLRMKILKLYTAS